MHESNRLYWIKPLANMEQQMNKQQESTGSKHFIIPFHRGILYKRRFLSGCRLLSTA
ncbi:hypothetical protein SAMN05428962_4978 [Paenibacillus sp. BC26]|nr:hypothetical protein SAMN05428962_4978 [Paenibacillus sp. BC26]